MPRSQVTPGPYVVGERTGKDTISLRNKEGWLIAEVFPRGSDEDPRFNAAAIVACHEATRILGVVIDCIEKGDSLEAVKRALAAYHAKDRLVQAGLLEWDQGCCK